MTTKTIAQGTGYGTGATGSGTTTSSGGSADQEGGCGEKDTSCKEPNPLIPWQGDVKDSLSESLKQSNITTAWGLTLDLINVVAIFALLAIAFANILHLGEKDEFNFKRMIPALVIGLILANFSHLICRAIIDFAAMLMNFFVPKNETMNVSFNLIIGMWSGLIQNPGYGAAGIGAIIIFMFAGLGCVVIPIAFILLFLPAVIIFILFLMLAVRVYVIWFLVIVSPIAFFAIMFSVFQKQIQWWWTWFFQWVFMGPIVYFMIYIAEGFARSDMFQDSGGTLPCFDPTAGQQVGGLSKYLFVNALLVLAIIIPYMMGKQVFSGLLKAGKILGVGGGKLGLAGSKLGMGITGRALEKAGLKRLGKGMRNLPYLPEAVFGKEGVLAKIGKANVGEVETDIEKTLRKGLPGTMRNVSSGFARDNGEKWALGQSSEQLRDQAANGMKHGDERNAATALFALGTRAQHANISQGERLEAARVLREDFGLTVGEASKIPFGDIGASDNGLQIARGQYNKERKEDPETGRDVVPRALETREVKQKDKTKKTVPVVPSVEAQFRGGVIPGQAVGTFDVDDPNRFRPGAAWRLRAREVERGGPAEAGPRAPTGGEEMEWLDEGEGGGTPGTPPPGGTPGGPAAPPGGTPPGGTPPVPPP